MTILGAIWVGNGDYVLTPMVVLLTGQVLILVLLAFLYLEER